MKKWKGFRTELSEVVWDLSYVKWMKDIELVRFAYGLKLSMVNRWF